MDAAGYDPFAPGRYPVGVRTFQAHDRARGRVFPCEIWYPAHAPAAEEVRDAAARRGPLPLIVFSHHGGGHRRKAVFLGRHLASHGYAVAAPDHSEVIAPELARPAGESGAGQAARIEAIIGSRVPDVRFLLDHLLTAGAEGLEFDPARVGLAGHSFGGWTVLAAPETEPRVSAVVALAPGGGGRPRPGVLPLTLGEQAHTFTRGLALAHLDAALGGSEAAGRFLDGDVEAALAARGVDAFAYPG